MRGLLIAGFCASLSACSDVSELGAPGEPEDISWQEQAGARQYATKAAPGAEVLAICGGSKGRAYFLDTVERGWVNDQIGQGRIILLRLPGGKLDILYRDASGRYSRPSEEGGDVQMTYAREASKEFGAVVVYPRTGVVESFNFLKDVPEGRVVLWTSNKAESAMGLRKAAVFIAKCAESA
jgi:hypothetical protein